MNNKTTYIKLRVNTRPHWEQQMNHTGQKSASSTLAKVRVTAQIVDDFRG